MRLIILDLILGQLLLVLVDSVSAGVLHFPKVSWLEAGSWPD